jgi:pentatricopeptide repeat protein
MDSGCRVSQVMLDVYTKAGDFPSVENLVQMMEKEHLEPSHEIITLIINAYLQVRH